MSTALEPRIHQWTRDEYYKMADAGLLQAKRVELIEGQIVEMSPMGSVHATGVVLAGKALERVFSQGYVVRWQMPLALTTYSEPEPDVAVVQGDVRNFTYQHPATAALVVEVSDTSLAYDRTTKAALYAEAGIEECWIINVVDRQLEVYRQPKPAADGRTARYEDVIVLKHSDTIASLAAPTTPVPVADLLP